MDVGLHVVSFSWPHAPADTGPTLGRIAEAAEQVGITDLSLMDHFFQLEMMGLTAEREMLEGYTTLGFLAAKTDRVRLGLLVTGVTYRHPGLLAKIVTTLDVLSGGRAQLGIGAAWNEREHQGLGVPFPSLKERFERLEEALQICLQMWSDDNGPFEGTHYRLAETLNVPQSLQRPHPPILVGGMGETKTLRLVARYADACNLFSGPGVDVVRQKLDVPSAALRCRGARLLGASQDPPVGRAAACGPRRRRIPLGDGAVCGHRHRHRDPHAWG
jgi:F420-dependent oxidoreductase-like protein